MQSIPVNKNITIVQNCTQTWELKFTLSNAPIDITGWTIIFMAKNSLLDTDAHAVISNVYHTADFIDPTNGRMLIQILKTQTTNPGNYDYAVKFITNSDPVDAGVIYYGKLTIQKGTIQSQ